MSVMDRPLLRIFRRRIPASTGSRAARRRLPLRLRIALLSGALALVVSFTLVLFINAIALDSFHRIILVNPTLIVQAARRASQDPNFFKNASFAFRGNPLERALLLELRTISLIGFGLVALLTSACAYWLAGLTLRPIKRVSEAAKRISASTLDTRLALPGPQDEVKELADTFDSMLGRLQSTFEQQGRFVGDVAHELRTPLASLRTNLEVVTSDPQADLEDYREMAATQERALTRLERLVSDLLILARSEQPPAQQQNLADVALGPLLEEVCSDLQSTAEKHDITLELRNERDLDVVVRGDAVLLARVFSNLVENGIYYNHPGGKVALALDQKASHAIIRIADTGIGIATDSQPHIFERFYRVEPTCRNRGTGLGLSIVAAITQQHGGHVQVESVPGQGSIFTVLLPLPAAFPVTSVTRAT
jgi:heavy metal sensor kinase